jgi:uncharacterized protein YajQ (UPF0234 family)
MAAPNIVNVSTITAKAAVANVTTSAVAILTNSAASGKVYKVNSLVISNIDGTAAADITVDFLRSAIAYHLASTISVPADASLVVISKETSLYLEEDDAIRVTASADGDLQAVCSYEELS